MYPKLEKREAILEAMLDLVVERGFHDAPMSLVAKRSGASAGVIYHYFASKDDVLRTLYERIREDKRRLLLAGIARDVPSDEAFVTFFCNAYRFYRNQKRETRFLDLYVNSTYYDALPEAVKSAPGDAVGMNHVKMFRPKKSGGVLKNLPIDVIDEFSLGLAARLAKKTETLAPAMLKNVARIAWSAVAEKA
jgi:AcrR family transcriptional regulator